MVRTMRKVRFGFESERYVVRSRRIEFEGRLEDRDERREEASGRIALSLDDAFWRCPRRLRVTTMSCGVSDESVGAGVPIAPSETRKCFEGKVAAAEVSTSPVAVRNKLFHSPPLEIDSDNVSLKIPLAEKYFLPKLFRAR